MATYKAGQLHKDKDIPLLSMEPCHIVIKTPLFAVVSVAYLSALPVVLDYMRLDGVT